MEDDYVKLPRYCFKSTKDRIIKSRRNFPGTLHIRHYADIGLSDFRNEFIIEGHPLPKQLYVRLPKENVYVPYEMYSAKYLNSKLAELRDLFIHLKAKTIKITKTEFVEKKIAAGAKASATNGFLSCGVGADFEDTTTVKNEFKEELHFDADNKPVDESTFEDPMDYDYGQAVAVAAPVGSKKPKFFYLPQEYAWEDIIERRLNNKLVQDKYTYEHTDSRLLQASVLSQLKIFDIHLDIENSERRQLKIEYDIEYHPLIKNEPPQPKPVEPEHKAIVEPKSEPPKFRFPKLDTGTIRIRRPRPPSTEEEKPSTTSSTTTTPSTNSKLERKRSLKDLVLEVMHVHPKTHMGTPRPSPNSSDAEIDAIVELEVNEVFMNTDSTDSIDLNTYNTNTEIIQKQKEEQCNQDKEQEETKEQQEKEEEENKEQEQMNLITGITLVLDNSADDEDNGILPKPSFPPRKIYEETDPKLDSLILPDEPISQEPIINEDKEPEKNICPPCIDGSPAAKKPRGKPGPKAKPKPKTIDTDNPKATKDNKKKPRKKND